MKSGWRKRLDLIVVGVVVLSLGLLAYVHRGVDAAEVDLHDGGVWVTNGSRHMVAHLNYQSQTLDGGLRTATSEFDVSQSGTDVLVASPTSVQPLDTATVSFTGDSSTVGVEVAQGGSTVLFADAAQGKVWASTVADAGGFSAASDPSIEELDRPRVAVGLDGAGYVLTADGLVRSVRGSGAEVDVKERGRIHGEVSAEAQLSVAGSTLLVLDGGLLRTTEREVDLGVDTAALQQPSNSGDEAVVATRDSLLRIPLRGGEPSRQQAASGRPAAPVLVDGCAYGVWAGSGHYVRDCSDDTFDHAAQYPELAAAKEPAFRVNRSVIVINDLVGGNVYLPLESMQRVDNWDLIAAQIEQSDTQEDDETDETELSQVQEFSEQQNAPVANDDELGARPGTATTLPILLNDVDVDGDVLTAVLKDVPKDVTVALAKDGRAARIEVPGGKTGTVSFTYQATDGVALSNVATVRVPIRTGANEAPKQMRKTTLNLAERATIEHAVLQDWADPDGDPIFLENAVGDDGLAVTWRPDGYISVRDLGTGGPGRRLVTVQVSDGTGVTAEQLVVQVSPGMTNTPPVANNDHYVAQVGATMTLRPLANDTDPDNDELRLIEVGSTASGVEVLRDARDDSLQFTASAPGTQTIVYAITDGPNTAKGKIRVDVVDPQQASDQPGAENDLALLPPNGSVIVEPLRNDFDPAGGVLVIQGVSMASSEGLNVEVVRHSLLRVTAPAGVTAPETFEYTVSNGAKSASAKVLVVPLAPKASIQAPVALPESTLVRAGDIVTARVLTNDYSPSDLAVSLMPDLKVDRGADLGEFFVSGDTVRFKAGDKPGLAEATYTVEDSEGNVASSTVSIAIRGFDERNQPPIPGPVEARTFAGMSVKIPIPMDGIDPDGDSVELVGASGSRLGSVTPEGAYLEYTAGNEAAGTDSFTYRVRDRFGAEGEGKVRVGIAPARTSNQPPVAVPDEIAARPHTRLEIPVVRNDVDPDGDDISIVAGSIEPITKGWDPHAEIDGQRVIVQTPAERGAYQFYYRITDGGGAPVTGVVTVTVDENVPPAKPIALDDYVPTDSIAGLAEVEVPVLVNDSDPDGARDALTVSADAPARVNGANVMVPLADDRQIVLYTITDSDGLSARAAVVVPGKSQVPPYLDPAKVPATVKGGETLHIDFGQYVITREGHSATLTSVDSVVAGQGGLASDAAQGLAVASDTLIEFTPDPSFIGATSVTFQVTDGQSLDDPRGLVATLSLPVQVESSGLFPPQLRPSGVQVAPGERPLEVSLRQMVDDPDPGDNEKMAFAVRSVSAPFNVTVAGQNAQVSVPADAAVGTTGSLVVSVHDGTTEPLEMTIPLSVTNSTRPPMTVSTITENEGRVGVPLTWDLTTYVTNPFADVGGELSLVGQPTVTGPATVSADGMRLTVTPTDSAGTGDAAEQAVVTYTVADATKDSSRHRTGVAQVTVKDTPKAPVNVAAEYVQSKTVRLTWSHSGWRGGQRKGFLVTWNGGTKDCGLTTSCVIDTLANDNTYTFTVQAQVTEADIADSAPSAPSNAIFVDVAPDVPTPPTGTFGDTKATLSWPQTSVPDGGSPVTKYTVQISPADQSGRAEQTVTGSAPSSWEWTNLKNGTEYRFRIAAHNKQTDLDNRVTPPQSEWSVGVIPAGQPSGQGAPSVVKDRAAAGVAPRATVNWGPPGNPNGDTALTYRLRMNGASDVLYEGPLTSRVVSMDVGTEDKSFQVQSTNKSGLWSEWSPASNAVRAFQPPGAPTGLQVAPTGVSNQARITFSAGAANGAKANELSYRWNAGGASGTIASGGTITNAALANGSNVSVTVTAISTVNGETAEGGAASATVNAYGPPAAPTASANRAGNGNVDMTWSMPSSSNGRTVEVQIVTSQNGSQRTVGLSGSLQEGTGPNQQRCLRARAVNSEGQASDWVERCASTRGQGGGYEYSPSGNQLWVRASNWYPNSFVTCKLTLADKTSYNDRFQVDGNGAADRRWAGAAASYNAGYIFDTDISDDCWYS
ncbi:MAG: fibronectin type III domain-containing protein [Nigerium sp.]|nr:fibronectin type III domain-containing protein [Nigerium sp.]